MADPLSFQQMLDGEVFLFGSLSDFEHGTIKRTGIICKKNPLLYARLSLQVVYC